jgi:hypothetical protein
VLCSGPLLDAVQMRPLFNDSKTFVDMPLRFDANTVSQFAHGVWPRAIRQRRHRVRQSLNVITHADSRRLFRTVDTHQLGGFAGLC